MVQHPHPLPLRAYSCPTQRAPMGSKNREIYSHEELNVISKVSLQVKVIFCLFSVIVPVRVVLRKTVVGEVTNNSLSQDYPRPDDHAKQKTDTPVFKLFTKVIFAVVKQLKQLQRKPRKKSEA